MAAQDEGDGSARSSAEGRICISRGLKHLRPGTIELSDEPLTLRDCFGYRFGLGPQGQQVRGRCRPRHRGANSLVSGALHIRALRRGGVVGECRDALVCHLPR